MKSITESMICTESEEKEFQVHSKSVVDISIDQKNAHC